MRGAMIAYQGSELAFQLISDATKLVRLILDDSNRVLAPECSMKTFGCMISEALTR